MTPEKVLEIWDSIEDCWNVQGILAFAAAILATKHSDAEPDYDCGNCVKCLDGKTATLAVGSSETLDIPLLATRMVLCPLCGNKRCPHASDHRFKCTNSNDSGQEGSVYKLHPQQPCPKCAEWIELGKAETRQKNSFFDQSCINLKRAEAAEARADKWQSAYAKEFDIRNGTPCEQIRWQQTLDDTRENLANVQVQLDDWIANAHRLALELNCILLSTDLPAATKWWDSAHEALEQHQAMIRLSHEEKLK